MAIDPVYLRQHYASLSDEALLSIDRSELVDTARKCYDEEFGRRGLNSGRSERRPEARPVVHTAEPLATGQPAAERGWKLGQAGAAGMDCWEVSGEEADWREDAAEVYSHVCSHRGAPDRQIANAREALEAAGIPCYLDESVIPEHKENTPEQHHWRVMVPGKLNMQAASILERDIFNDEIEANWRTHLETLSNEEVLAMDPQEVFCGLFDRIERVNRVYDEEIARRNLDS